MPVLALMRPGAPLDEYLDRHGGTSFGIEAVDAESCGPSEWRRDNRNVLFTLRHGMGESSRVAQPERQAVSCFAPRDAWGPVQLLG